MTKPFVNEQRDVHQNEYQYYKKHYFFKRPHPFLRFISKLNPVSPANEKYIIANAFT